MSHIEVAIAAGEDSECNFRSASQVGYIHSYVKLYAVTGDVRSSVTRKQR